MQTALISVLTATSNQTTHRLPLFLCFEGYFEKQFFSAGSNQHFLQGWGNWKVNGGERASMSITSQTANSVQRKKPKRQGWKLTSDYSFFHSLPLAQKILSTRWYVLEVCHACQKALAVSKQGGVVEASQPTAALQVSVFRWKQGQVLLLPHLVKIMGFLGVTQVLRGTRGPKPKGVCVTAVLHSGFCNLLPPRHTILPRRLCQCTHSELLSPAVM